MSEKQQQFSSLPAASCWNSGCAGKTNHNVGRGYKMGCSVGRMGEGIKEVLRVIILLA